MKYTVKEHPYIVICVIVFFISFVPASSKNETQAIDKLIQQTLAEAQKAEAQQNAPIAARAYGKAVALTRKKPKNKQKDLPMLLYSQGLMLTYAGAYENAVAPIDEAVRLAHTTGDKITEARSLTEMGIINFFLNDWDRALSYYRRAEVIAKEIDNKQGLSIIVNDISNIYQKKHDYQRAIIGYQQTLEMQRELRDSATICNTLFNIGTCYEELHKEAEAEPYIQHAYKIASAIKDAEIYSLSAAHIANNLMKKGKKAEALQLFDKGEKMTHESEYKGVRAEIYHVRSTALEQAGDYKGALIYYKKMDMLDDSLQKEDAQKQISELQIKYKTAEKERIMERQKEIIHQKNVMLHFLVCGVLACIVIIFITNRYRRLVRRRNRELRSINNMKDKFFSVISHDLKNPVLAQKNSLAALVNNFGHMESSDIHEICIELLDSSKSLLDLLYNLLSWSRLQTGRIIYTPSPFPLIDVVREVENLTNVQLNEKSLTLNVTIPVDATVVADRNMISTVMRNLISNAIKFSYKGGTIDISAKRNETD